MELTAENAEKTRRAECRYIPDHAAATHTVPAPTEFCNCPGRLQGGQMRLGTAHAAGADDGAVGHARRQVQLVAGVEVYGFVGGGQGETDAAREADEVLAIGVGVDG